jgi:thiamine biosynthesis lipoprotein
VVERRLAAMGTVLSLAVSGRDRATALEASEAAVGEIARVEERLTTWRPGGPLSRLNAASPGETVVLGGEVAGLLAAVLEWSERTQRAFDPTVLPLVRAWDLRGGGRVPASSELARALVATGPGRFRIDTTTAGARRLSPDAGIDEGAWGKGYALDRAVGELCRTGVRKALLDLGGQVSAIGRATVAIADPRDRARIAVFLSIADESVSTSGNSERGLLVGGRRIGHMLDPRTGRPAPDFGSVTVVASSGLAADILSTAFFVLGPEKGLDLSEKLRCQGQPNEVLFLVVSDGGWKAVASPGLQSRLECHELQIRDQGSPVIPSEARDLPRSRPSDSTGADSSSLRSSE